MHCLSPLVSSARRASYLQGYFLPGWSELLPIPDLSLNRTDADIFLVFLSPQGIVLRRPVPDPWYNITRAVNLTSGNVRVSDGAIYNNLTSEYYMPAETSNPLGCRLQDQVCNSGTGECGRPGPAWDAFNFTIFPDRSVNGQNGANETRRVDWLSKSVFAWGDIGYMIYVLNGRSLLSRKGAFELTDPFPEHQWTLDAEHWLSLSLSLFQQGLVTTASGPRRRTGAEWPKYLRRPTFPEETALCSSQVSAPRFVLHRHRTNILADPKAEGRKRRTFLLQCLRAGLRLRRRRPHRRVQLHLRIHPVLPKAAEGTRAIPTARVAQ
jgi:hypothetical protein